MHCRACFHPDRDKIDADLVAGVPVRMIHAKTGLSLGGITRHKDHVRNIIKERGPVERSEHGADLLKRVENVLSEAQSILTSAKSKEDYKSAVAALNAITRALELLGRASGELQPNSGVHLSLNRTTITNNLNVEPGSDAELAQLIGEATNGFDPAEIERLKLLAQPENATILSLDAPQNGNG